MTKLYRWRTDQWFPVDNDQSRLGERGKCVYKYEGYRTREFLCGDGATLYHEWCQLHKFIHGIKYTELYT